MAWNATKDIANKKSGTGGKFMDMFRRKSSRPDEGSLAENPYEEESKEIDLPAPDMDAITDPCDKFVASLPFSRMEAANFMSKVD